MRQASSGWHCNSHSASVHRPSLNHLCRCLYPTDAAPSLLRMLWSGFAQECQPAWCKVAIDMTRCVHTCLCKGIAEVDRTICGAPHVGHMLYRLIRQGFNLQTCCRMHYMICSTVVPLSLHRGLKCAAELHMSAQKLHYLHQCSRACLPIELCQFLQGTSVFVIEVRYGVICRGDTTR